MKSTQQHNAKKLIMVRTISGKVVTIPSSNNLSSLNVILGITIILALLGIIITILG